MLKDSSAIIQTLVGTLFTWGLTAVGASLVFLFHSNSRKILDSSLGFAAGVMLAASYWSLLEPAIELAQNSSLYGANGQWAFVPVAIGFGVGSVFVYYADLLLPHLDTKSAQQMSVVDENHERNTAKYNGEVSGAQVQKKHRGKSNSAHRRRKKQDVNGCLMQDYEVEQTEVIRSWKRILLLIIAITVHNIPEGLAVGVGFGAIGTSPSATFENARNLAIGIGLQNFPEGLAVSLPLRGSGVSLWRSFWYGQLSGMVEPIAGLFGAFAVTVAQPVLPYALAFAAGAMVFVVVDDIIPEAQTNGNGKLASISSIIGFIVMMAMDVGLG